MHHLARFHQIGQTVVEIWKIWQFNGFQNAGRPPSWICKIRIFLTDRAVKRLNLHQHTKFHRDQSRCCGDIAIFVIFKMTTAAILDFQKFEILTVDLM